jgi:hypothetical protein
VENTNYQDILDLCSTLEAETVLRAREATRFLWDTTAYTTATNMSLEDLEIDPLTLRQTGFTALEEHAMARNISPLVGPPRGGVYGFKIPEILKERCRPVWACYLNDNLDTVGYKLQSQQRIWRDLHGAIRVIAFDGKSMYDQFPLSQEVKNFFAFRLRDGTPACLSQLPMGFGPACEIAQLCALILASFDCHHPHFSLRPLVHIDNFAFIITPTSLSWTPQELEEFSSTIISKFFQRCLSVNFQLNEASKTEIEQYLSATPETQVQLHKEWCPSQFVLLGIQYDLVAKTRAIAPKTTKKLEAIRNVMFKNGSIQKNLTPRQIAVAFGVARWAARSISHKHCHYKLFEAASNLGALLHSKPELWDKPMSSTSQFGELASWYSTLLENKPAPIWHLVPDNSPVLIVDACSTGWGGVLVHNDAVKIVSGQWDNEIENSVESEPKGTLAALKSVDIQASDIIIVTDHEPLIFAALSQQAHGWFYYSLLNSLKSLWPQRHFHFSFVEGIHNPADAPSRGREMEEHHTTGYCRAMAAAAGMGASWALLNPSRDIPGILVSSSFDANQLPLLPSFW